MLTPLDYVVIVVYFLAVVGLGILWGGRQKSTRDYFLGDGQLPWWAICFSIVATETSTLTVIGIPAVAYGGPLTFFQLTLGYLLGRIVVSLFLLPRYAREGFVTAYAFLGERFGQNAQATASVTFLVTRLLADGVRLFATAIPIKIIADSAGFSVSYMSIIVVIALLTIGYTLVGGIRAVVWMDVIQMVVYVGGGILAVGYLMQALGDQGGLSAWWSEASAAGKTVVFDPTLSIQAWLTSPYALVTAVVGGAIFSMASHGTDQLIVQRLLACKNLRESQKALVGSGILVMGQFALFLLVGLLLWGYYDGQSVEALGLLRGDEVYPKYIIEGLPAGVSGFLLAGIVAAAMSTLSSSLNALASSTMTDLYPRFFKASSEPADELRRARWATFFWGIVFIGFASLFQDRTNPVVELGLAIASFTYGGLLGIFLFGIWNKRARQADAIAAFLLTVILLALIIKGVWFDGESWRFWLNPSTADISANGLRSLAWPWYTAIGALFLVGFGSLFTLRHRFKTR